MGRQNLSSLYLLKDAPVQGKPLQPPSSLQLRFEVNKPKSTLFPEDRLSLQPPPPPTVREQDEWSGSGLVTPGDTESVSDPLCSPTSPLSIFSQCDEYLLWGQHPGDEPVSSALWSPSL